MATYERMTSASMKEALNAAKQILPERIPLEIWSEDSHSVTMRGEDGTITVSVHRHGVETQVLVQTNQLRTSRIDVEAQYLLGKLPYQPGNTAFAIGDQG